jgi:hypothetical protein
MSTLPGPETWRDAGLDQVDPGGDVEIAADGPQGPASAPDPDVVAEANPADVVEQAQPAGPDGDATEGLTDVDVLVDANPADVVEQAQSVPPDERDEYP